MIRTQVYLTAEQHAALRRAAEREGSSMTEVLRRMVDRQLMGSRQAPRFDKEAVLSFVGLGESGESGISAEHDAALREALRAETLR
jgi:hypothetical protein